MRKLLIGNISGNDMTRVQDYKNESHKEAIQIRKFVQNYDNLVKQTIHTKGSPCY